MTDPRPGYDEALTAAWDVFVSEGERSDDYGAVPRAAVDAAYPILAAAVAADRDAEILRLQQSIDIAQEQARGNADRARRCHALEMQYRVRLRQLQDAVGAHMSLLHRDQRDGHSAVEYPSRCAQCKPLLAALNDSERASE